jgi:multicomponent Na+:H+ antiporter subunit E
MRRTARRVWRLSGLGLYFLYDLVASSLQVAWDVVTPRHRSRPGVIAVPLDLRSAGAVTALAHLVSLTPGSLSLDVSADRSMLFVHAMFIDDPAAERARIKNQLERRIREASA